MITWVEFTVLIVDSTIYHGIIHPLKRYIFQQLQIVIGIRGITRILRFFTLPATKTLVHSFISPRLDYCTSVLSGLPDCDIQKLQCVHNAAAHLQTHSKKYNHITPFSPTCTGFQCGTVYCLKSLSSHTVLYMVLPCPTSNPYSTLTSLALCCTLPQSYPSLSLALTASPMVLGAFCCFAPAQYNQLPESLSQLPTLPALKSGLETHLFQLTFS